MLQLAPVTSIVRPYNLHIPIGLCINKLTRVRFSRLVLARSQASTSVGMDHVANFSVTRFDSINTTASRGEYAACSAIHIGRHNNDIVNIDVSRPR